MSIEKLKQTVVKRITDKAIKSVLDSEQGVELVAALKRTDTLHQKYMAIHMVEEFVSDKDPDPEMIGIAVKHVWDALPGEVMHLHIVKDKLDLHFIRPDIDEKEVAGEWNLEKLHDYGVQLDAQDKAANSQ